MNIFAYLSLFDTIFILGLYLSSFILHTYPLLPSWPMAWN
jgi:hypothetical protein